MTKEVPFKSIRITLSEEAIRMLGSLRYVGTFRSDSMTVEECIRTIYDVAEELSASMQRAADKGEKPIPPLEQAIILQRIGLRLKRFVKPPKKKQKT